MFGYNHVVDDGWGENFRHSLARILKSPTSADQVTSIELRCDTHEAVLSCANGTSDIFVSQGDDVRRAKKDENRIQRRGIIPGKLIRQCLVM